MKASEFITEITDITRATPFNRDLNKASDKIEQLSDEITEQEEDEKPKINRKKS